MCAKRTIVVSALILMLSVVEAYPQTRTTRSFGTVDDTLINLDFNKGTLDEYVQAVMEAKKGKVTIIIDSDLEDIEVPPAHLRNVSLAQALEWIPKTSTARQQGLSLQIMPRPGRTDEDSSMFLFTTLPLAVPTGTSRDDTQVKTFALNWATDSTNPELVKTAVQDALSTRGLTASKPVAYNPQTGILTLRGTSRDVTIASQVMNELKQAQQQAKIIEQLQTELDALKDRVAELQSGAGEKRSK